MLAVILFLLVLLSGSALCCARFDCRFEEIVPLSEMALVFVLFLFGLAGSLLAGVYAVLALALAAYVLAAVAVKRRGDPRGFLRRFFTPGFALFLVLAAALLAFNYGRLLASWDDFTHWGDVVLVMTELDDFATNPLSHSLFPEYPPGISLFQYFLQKLFVFAGGAPFTEWALYYAHQLLFFCLFLPFMKKLDFKRPYAYLIPAILFLLPLGVELHDLMFQRTTVDTIMAALYGCVLAQCLMPGEKSRLDKISICMMLAFLPMFKGLGILFALTGALVYLLPEIKSAAPLREKAKLGLAAAGSVLLPRFLWELHVRSSGAKRAFSMGMSGGLMGADGYRAETLKNFIKAFLERDMASNRVSNTLFPTPVFLTVLLLTLLLFCLQRYDGLFPSRRGLHRKLFWAIAASFAVDFVGIGLAYMFSFSVWEAVELASFERYVGTVFIAGGYMLVLLSVDLIQRGALNGSRLTALVLCGLVALTPWTPVLDYVGRGGPAYSVEFRQPYEELRQQVEAAAGGEASRIYLVSSDSVDKVVLRYVLRPHTVNIDHMNQMEFVNVVWDSGVPNTYDGGELSPAEAWREDLKANFDYVLLVHLNEGLAEKFGSVFTDPGDIQERSLYRVDRESGLLTLCA